MKLNLEIVVALRCGGVSGRRRISARQMRRGRMLRRGGWSGLDGVAAPDSS